MARLRKMLTRGILTEQVLVKKDEDKVQVSRSNVLKSTAKEVREQSDQRSSIKATVKRQRKRKQNRGKRTMNKKSKLEERSENCAKPSGTLIKVTFGNGKQEKCHYQTFEFFGEHYSLEDSVMLVPQKEKQKHYVAIIKDIYVKGKEENVKLEVQWLYRPEDVHKKCVRNLNSNDARDLFYSFHRDEICAESVMRNCVVHFVPANKQIPNPREHPGYVVQNVYDFVKKKLRTFDYKEFTNMEKLEVDLLVAKTISRLGDLPDVLEEQSVVNLSKNGLILEKFDMLTGDMDRDKRLEELLESMKDKCRVTKEKKAGDSDFYWPDDVVLAVGDLEQVVYDSSGQDTVMYGRKLEVLVDKLENSIKLAERLLNGELKPEQVTKMTSYELTRGHAFYEMIADIEEPMLRIDGPSTSRNVGA